MPRTQKKRLGDLLLESGLITQEQLNTALDIQRRTDDRLGDILVQQGFITERQMFEVLEFQLGIPYVDLDRTFLDIGVVRMVPIQVARTHNAIPVRMDGNMLWLAMSDPLDIIAMDDIHRITDKDVVPMLADAKAIERAIEQYYGDPHAEQAIEEYKREIAATAEEVMNDMDTAEAETAPIIKLINSVIEQAVKIGASDIHIEPMEDEVRIRLRIDGRLQNYLTVPQSFHAPAIARIKIMANLNIAEKRLPQDGRININVLSRDIDLRVSTIPTVNGEKAVMRVLDKTNFLIPKDQLGFDEKHLSEFDKILRAPNGMILVTGPTGSGKSTTLYTMLNELNDPAYNIITIEDPVEYMVDGVNQIQINTKAGLTFASGLRSILRQDPDIIMVGEIRDGETAEIAVRAAITGHVVLSTLHTNDAPGTVVRLIDMGIEPYLVSSSVVAVIAQRLVRRICPQCKETYEPPISQKRMLGIPDDAEVYHGRGCPLCNGTGYKGRQGVFEIMRLTRAHRDAITRRVTTDELRELAVVNGMSTLRDECAKLVLKGITTADEAIATAYGND
ncbi:GspE/PulE family protein [Mahella australiensis]|uniref:Type II secretion system protein E (GspE) n=1 Tax=Mahella australiensis (strain DSM 15567 / CIP 107919 / 50-1 BON) TaxID=697281 RepID=F4A396_MAHA5|nr:GspE/PulE family protein [Mahella australiensis]AEE96329.1 type II secretion system protein E (GspE) [Mahella australiensis 50-1 BON]